MQQVQLLLFRFMQIYYMNVHFVCIVLIHWPMCIGEPIYPLSMSFVSLNKVDNIKMNRIWKSFKELQPAMQISIISRMMRRCSNSWATQLFYKTLLTLLVNQENRNQKGFSQVYLAVSIQGLFWLLPNLFFKKIN